MASAHASPAGQGEILGAAAVTGTCRPRSILTIATSLASRDRVPVRPATVWEALRTAARGEADLACGADLSLTAGSR
jgi:hypothetical protein